MYAFVIRLPYVREGIFLLVIGEWWGCLLWLGGNNSMGLPWGTGLNEERMQQWMHPWFLLFLG